MLKKKSHLANNSNQEVCKIFELLKLDEAGMAKAIEDMFQQAANDPQKKAALSRLVAAMSNPRTRAAVNWAIRWGVAMEESRAARAAQKNNNGEAN
jgi:hypothetical protein